MLDNARRASQVCAGARFRLATRGAMCARRRFRVSGGHVDVAGVVTTGATALHRAPRLFSRAIATIPAGDTVDVLHCGSRLGSGWRKVAYGGAVGYVRGGLLARNVYQ